VLTKQFSIHINRGVTTITLMKEQMMAKSHKRNGAKAIEVEIEGRECDYILQINGKEYYCERDGSSTFKCNGRTGTLTFISKMAKSGIFDREN